MKAYPLIKAGLWGMIFSILLVSCKPAMDKGGFVEIDSPEALLINQANFDICVPGLDGKLVVYTKAPSLFFVCGQEHEEIDDGMMYLYLPEDGRKLNFRLEGDLLYVNDVLRAITLVGPESGSFQQWYASAADDDVSNLRCVSAHTTDFHEEIMALHARNPRITAVDKEGYLAGISAPSAPLFLIINEEGETSTPDVDEIEKMDLSKTRILMYSGSDPDINAVLAKKGMPSLGRLLFAEEPAGDEIFRMFPDIQAVTLYRVESTLSLATLQKLEELHAMEFADDDTVLDLGQLPNPSALRVLTVAELEKVKGIEKAVKLECLNPGDTSFSNEELASLIAVLPNLRFLDLTYATVESLQPLQAATELEGLVIGEHNTEEDTLPDLSPLAGLKHIRFIGLPDNLSTNQAIVDAIHQVCPECTVYGRTTFCLGSGWLVLFLPMLLLVMWFKKGRRHP